MIKGIIFDLDGTLVRLPINYDVIFEKLKNLFDTKDEFKPLIPTIVSKANGDNHLIQKAFDLICNEETISAKNFEIIDGALDILSYFKKKNLFLGLITMQCNNAATLVLDNMNIKNYFSSIVTRDQTYDRAEQISQTVNFSSLPPSEILVVGDRIHDIHSAKKVGCLGILSNKEKLNSFKESTVISKLVELKELDLSKTS